MPRLVQSPGDGYVFPLGIAYVSASMKAAGYNVFCLNLNHHEGDVPDVIREAIEAHEIQVVATGGLSPQFHLVRSVVESAKQVDDAIVTVVGGGLISAEPKVAMEALELVDFGVIGEGEVTMCELARCLEAGGEPAEVDGIVYRDGPGFSVTGRREDIADLDSIPWPDWAGFDVDKYLEAPSANFAGVHKNRVICILGSRSCPYRCTFCFHTNGHKYRQRSLDDFFAELDHLVASYNIEYISLADELFAPDIKRAREFCERIKKYDIPWYADFRINKITPELLKALDGSGLDVMFIGLESADNVVLKSMHKGITIEQTETALELVNEAGFAIYGCFIFGDIVETMDTAHRTMDWWRAHPQYNVHLTLVKPFPGSQIYKHACAEGIIEDPIKYLKDGCPQVNISQMSDAEFSEITRLISLGQRHIKPLESMELLWVDTRMGRESVSGRCPTCSCDNTWENIKLFANDYIYCDECGQKFDIPCPPALRENLERNVAYLVERFGKIAVWGMTLTIMDLFGQSRALHDPGVFAVDISESKQQMDMHGKQIHCPAVLDEEVIGAVVVAVPSHAGSISAQVKENHAGVEAIIDICRLVSYDPEEIL